MEKIFYEISSTNPFVWKILIEICARCTIILRRWFPLLEMRFATGFRSKLALWAPVIKWSRNNPTTEMSRHTVAPGKRNAAAQLCQCIVSFSLNVVYWINVKHYTSYCNFTKLHSSNVTFPSTTIQDASLSMLSSFVQLIEQYPVKTEFFLYILSPYNYRGNNTYSINSACCIYIVEKNQR